MKHVCLVVGAGDATGAAIARKFSKEGFRVACARRNGSKLQSLIDELGNGSRGYSCDAQKEEQVEALVQQVEKELGPIKVVVHNVGRFTRAEITDTSESAFREAWEACALSAFLVGKTTAKCMLEREQEKGNTIIFTGATASVRGGIKFGPFAAGMHAKRALAQSMAKELGPRNIHVAHVIIDGVIGTQLAPTYLGQERFDEMTKRDELLLPDAIADAYFSLTQQHRSAWTFEMDLRPYSEKF